MTTQNEIVHIALVLDASGSMYRLASKVVQMADEQIQELKTASEKLDVETRVSVYTFSYHNEIRCLIFDKDVFRLPSIKGLYEANGQTALIDATIKSQHDLAATAQMYGKHHFRTYVWTDGIENDSLNGPSHLKALLDRQGDNFSVAVLVPDDQAQVRCIAAGFSPGNVLIWTVSAAGMEEAAKKVSRATSDYMTSVSKGVSYDKNNVFGTGADKVNAATVATLVPLTPGSFQVWDVTADERIDDFVRRENKGKFNVGKGFYPLEKRENIQANKDILIMEKATGKVYGGAAARSILGLPASGDVRVTPNANPEYTVFIQSTANNRKLLKGWKLIYLR